MVSVGVAEGEGIGVGVGGVTSSAVDKSNYRCCCEVGGDQRAPCVKQRGAASNFPVRSRNVGILKIIGEDFGYIPPLAGHIEIVIDTGELKGAEEGILLVSEAADAIIVVVIPKSA